MISLAAFMLANNEEHIGNMAVSMITGLKHTQLSGFVPTFTDTQLNNFNETLKDLTVKTLLSLTGNVMQTLLSILIFFLTLSMLLYYGETIWNAVSCSLSPKIRDAFRRMAEISESTVFSQIIVQVSAAFISFAIAIPFFYFLGYGDVLLFLTLKGFAMLAR
jgi:predicted PurR-regulated permease PerM